MPATAVKLILFIAGITGAALSAVLVAVLGILAALVFPPTILISPLALLASALAFLAAPVAFLLAPLVSLATTIAGIALGAVGFTTGGVAAGSFAAAWQSAVLGPMTGGVFSVLQSAGATMGSPAAAKAVGGIVAYLAGLLGLL
ncbi:hypothetical protein BKA70DRAFT_1403770 [Coprinopsis sp. MPI-PUGE-AT-0042]|nr:hypothetical protein BKA70DRAFT_1403770 [Coprinopsis sp. MPI-PUGE-AT-0042]